MAADVQDLRGKVAIEGAEKAAADLKKVHTAGKGLGEGLKSVLGTATSFLVGLGFADVAGKAVGFLTDNIGAWIEGARQAEVQQNATNRILASGNHVIGLTADQVDALATQYMNLTGIDDDIIHQAENIFAGYKNISKDAFPATIKTALDLARAQQELNGGNLDVIGTSKSLALALAQPEKAERLLRTAGIVLTEQQKQQIKTFMAHGDVAKADAVIMDAVKAKVDGAAEAYGKTNQGKIEKFHTIMDNFGKMIGGIIVPILGDLMEAVTPLIQAFGDFLPGAVQSVKDGFQHLKETLAPLGPVIEQIQQNAHDLWQLFVANLGPSIKRIQDAFKGGGPDLHDFASHLSDLVFNVTKLAGDLIPKVAGFINNLTERIAEFAKSDTAKQMARVLQQIGQHLAEAMPHIIDFATTVGGKLLEGAKNLGPHLKQFADFIGQSKDKMQAWKPTLDAVGNFLGNVVAPILGHLKDKFVELLPHIKDFGKWLQEHIVPAVKNLAEKFKEAQPHLQQLAKDISERLAPILKNMGDFINNVLLPVLGAIGEFIKTQIEPKLKDFKAFWDLIWPGIQATIETVWGVIQGIITIAWNIISGIIKIGLDILGGNWKQAWKDMQGMFSGVWKGIQQIGQSLFGKLRDFIVSKAIEIKDNVVAKFNELKTNAQNKLGELKDNALKTIGELPGKLKDLGTQMIQRLIDGIQGMAGTLGNTVHNIIKNAFSNLPGGIHVPGFASGTMDAPGGLAYVHRDELVYLPQHSQVYTAAQTRDILGALGLGHAAQARTSTASTINVYPQQAVLDTAELARIQHRRDLLNGVRG